MVYQSLEPGPLKSIGVESPSFDGTDISLLSTSTFLFMFSFTLIIGAVFFQLVRASLVRMGAGVTEDAISRSNKMYKGAVYGLIGLLALSLIFFTVNKDMISGDVGLQALKVNGVSVVGSRGGSTAAVPPAGAAGAPGTGKACEDPTKVISRLTSDGGLCGNVSCTVLSGCNYQTYLPIIERETGGDSDLKKMIIVTMCKESKASATAANTNPNNTYDCGLMQVNQKTPCDQASLDPSENIKRGVAEMRKKMTLGAQTFQNIPTTAGTFASYNCCANGTIPNSPSNDCTPASGFPYTLPKWACPINPGEGQFNMCAVKSYACELSVCMDKL